MTARNCKDLLNLALHDKGHEEVDEVNVACDIDLVQACGNFINLLGPLAAVKHSMLAMTTEKSGVLPDKIIDLQSADIVIGVELGRETCVGNQDVDALVTHNLFSIGSGLLQAAVVGEVSMEDVNVGTVTQLRCYLLLSASLVADDANDYILRVRGEVLQESVLGWIRQGPCGETQ